MIDLDNLGNFKTFTLSSRDIRVKLLYRGLDVNYLWKEYDIEFPKMSCCLTEYGEIYLNDAKQSIKIIKDFLINEEMQNVNTVVLQSKYIGVRNDIKIIADVITSKSSIRQLRIDEL